MLNPTPGNPLVYEDCNGDKPQILRNIYTGNPLVYKDCNRKDERDTADRRDWQPTCLRGLQPEKCTDACIRYKLATHLSTRIATTSSSDVFCTCNLATHLSTRIATEYKKYITRYTVTGNPLVYEDCNNNYDSYYDYQRAWQPTCLRGLQRSINPKIPEYVILATHLSTRIATLWCIVFGHDLDPGNPLVYEDCNDM